MRATGDNIMRQNVASARPLAHALEKAARVLVVLCQRLRVDARARLIFPSRMVGGGDRLMNKGVLYGLLAAVLFGASTPFAKVLVAQVPPVMLAGLFISAAASACSVGSCCGAWPAGRGSPARPPRFRAAICLGSRAPFSPAGWRRPCCS